MSDKAIRHLKKDPKMAEIIKKVGQYSIKLKRNRYESLVEAIITQQLSGTAARSISAKFRSIYSGKFPKPIDVINTSDAKLRKTGLSKMKVSYINDLSEKIESKELKINRISRLPDEEVVMELTKIKGIGKWTAEMFLIFSLGREDVLPVGDLGIKKAFQKWYSFSEFPSDAEMFAIAEKWRPYRTIATWYLWKSLQKFDAIG